MSTTNSELQKLPTPPSGDNSGEISNAALSAPSSPPDAPGGGSSSSVSYSAANSITSAGTYSNKTYKSTTADQNSVLVSLSSGTV
ncbi:MAG: hypothetical protein SR2Q5_07595, partial [Quinella sp. 2Q5]|nr:hypothetical protein [Quinella sp. 2Q5]